MNIKNYFKEKYKGDMLFTNSGRAALQAVIEDFKLENSKIILPAFICTDVFSVLLKQNNISPIFIDCPKDDFNITLKDIKKQYNKQKNKKQIKSLLVVHTFGKVNKDIKEISKFCQEKNLVLIEDCAHRLSLKLSGDAAIFTFNKVTNIPIGGVYIKRKGKIKIKGEPYKLNPLDIYRILQSNILGKLIIKILKTFKMKGKVKINPEKIEILSLSKFANFFSLKKQFRIIPKLIENRDKTFEKLIKKGIRAEKYWTPILEPEKNPNAKRFSDRIICVIKEELFSSP